MPRPKKEFSEKEQKQLEMLSGFGWKLENLARFFDISVSTLSTPRFQKLIKRGRVRMKASILAKQFEVAMGSGPIPAQYLKDAAGNFILNKDGEPIRTMAEQPPQKPNVYMLKWLGMNYCDQTERLPMLETIEPLEFIDPDAAT